jgi:hypothetical protein
VTKCSPAGALLLAILLYGPLLCAQQNSPPPLPIVDQIKKAVVFVQTNWSDENGKPQHEFGTAFWVFVEVPELGKNGDGNPQGYYCLVTAKHMIRQKNSDGTPGSYAESMTVRYNTKNPVDSSGRKWNSFDLTITDPRKDLVWFVDEQDPAADVVATIAFPPADADYMTIGEDTFATKDFVKQQQVNENDEVLFAGLFTNYPGASQNYPIVRHGKLALLPNEDIATDPQKPDKHTQVYFAEVASFGGNSGSPVFVRLDPFRETTAVGGRLAYSYRLLGVMQGFFSDADAKQNSGIATVVPADKILDVLSGASAKAYSDRVIANYYASESDWDNAAVRFGDAINLLTAIYPDSSQLVVTLRDYATMLHQAKRESESAAMMAKAQALDRTTARHAEP